VVRSQWAATCRGGTLSNLQPNGKHMYTVIITKIALTRGTISV